jgi:hypothetical protein
VWTFAHTVAAFVLVAVAMRVAPAPAEQKAAPDRMLV